MREQNMGKGSSRRKGEGYEDGWARIFGKKDEAAKNAELRARLDAMPLASPLCTEPFCQCEEGKCVWRKFDAEDDGK